MRQERQTYARKLKLRNKRTETSGGGGKGNIMVQPKQNNVTDFTQYFKCIFPVFACRAFVNMRETAGAAPSRKNANASKTKAKPSLAH